jgi:hypothetical protein
MGYTKSVYLYNPIYIKWYIIYKWDIF